MAKKAEIAAPSGSDEWEHKSNLETIMKAHEIMEDAEKMKHVHKIAGRHKKILSGLKMPEDPEAPAKSIEDIKKKGQKKFGSGSNM